MQPLGGVEVAGGPHRTIDVQRATQDREFDSDLISPAADPSPHARIAINIRAPIGMVKAQASADGAFEDGLSFRQENMMDDDDDEMRNVA
jgi:hypothetical protein